MILRILALVCFIVAVVIAQVVDAPDPLDILAFIGAGLAFWVASSLAGDRL